MMNGKKEFLGKRMTWIPDPPAGSWFKNMASVFMPILHSFAVPSFRLDCL